MSLLLPAKYWYNMLGFLVFFFFSTGMDPRTLHVLGKQSNTKLDAQPLNLYFSMPQKPLNISRNWCGFASESVNINENCSLGSWEFKEDVHFDLWSHPDEARRKGCFSLFFFFLMLLFLPSSIFHLMDRLLSDSFQSKPAHIGTSEREREARRVGGEIRRQGEPRVQPQRPDSLNHTLSLACASLQFGTSYLTLPHTVSLMSSPRKKRVNISTNSVGGCCWRKNRLGPSEVLGTA